MEGPEGIAAENNEDNRGRTKRMRSGRRFDNAPIALCGLSSSA